MKKVYYAIAALIVFISACKKEASVNEAQSQNTPGKVITYHLKNGGQVTAQINNRGEYVVGGDVILSKDQIAYLEYNKVSSDKTSTPRSTFTTEFQKLWPGGVVYYTISNTINSSNIGLAINEWESNTSIRFIQRTNQTNYVDFSYPPTQGSGSSQLGMIGGRQEIKLVNNASFRTVVHEIGHAVGLMHEQTRSDRDQYINVNYGNINNDWKSQYDIYNLGAGYQTGTFDFNSIMLYRSYAVEASVNGNPSPQMTKKDGSTWSDSYYLSQGDIDGVNYLYMPINIDMFYTDEYVNEQNEYVNRSTRQAKIKFYDINFNQMGLPKPIKIKIVSTRKEYNNHNYVYEVQESIQTLSVNTQEYFLGTEIFQEQYDQNMNEVDGSYSITYYAIRIQ
ncbi:hypothetical protein H9N25_05510 [Pedobacter riviphilus]|uniref:Peptidase M12A domain-containing protein n=1 Tax=Pedobacter riviphilus TaxID=2766984 RepID=A0ABX6TQU7_9SPHI|nr:M12 family metallopeptidase [Pedobacter riviphilus]QNR85905.1 hypothetical protein H9N25_05510 [Pedobacter riviphilus]